MFCLGNTALALLFRLIIKSQVVHSIILYPSSSLSVIAPLNDSCFKTSQLETSQKSAIPRGQC